MYEHTQYGKILTGVLAVSVLLMFIFMLLIPPAIFQAKLILIILLSLFIIVALLFFKMTISVTQGYLIISTGFNIINIKYNLSQIKDMEQTEIKSYYGLGIRWLPENTIMYSVAPSEALKIIFDDGKKVIIGTDEPEKLKEAIQKGT